MRTNNLETIAQGRAELLALHPEWPDNVKQAAAHGQVLPPQSQPFHTKASFEPTHPDPPYPDFKPWHLSNGMTRLQTIAAWGYPEKREPGFIAPQFMEFWTYTSVSPSIHMVFDADVMCYKPDYQYEDAYRHGQEVLTVPLGEFGYKKESSTLPPK